MAAHDAPVANIIHRSIDLTAQYLILAAILHLTILHPHHAFSEHLLLPILRA
jgi:hypothetical protein